jgi:beta-mannanase
VKAAKQAFAKGIVPHVTWELFWPSKNPNNTAGTDKKNGYNGFNEILAGEHDDYIDQYARSVKDYGGPVLIRFLHEFNGNWYVWSGRKNGAENGGPEKVVAVWQYVVDRFRDIGADNALWLWTPHGPSIDLSTEEWNDVKHYWPGDDYVDWIGLDAYNFYPKDPWGGERPYRDFDNCFRDLYDKCAQLGNHPMAIAEFGTGEFEYKGLTKSDWVKDAFTKIKTEYPRIKLFTWFHINKELDWRVNSRPETQQAFQEVLKDPYYIGSPFK